VIEQTQPIALKPQLDEQAYEAAILAASTRRANAIIKSLPVPRLRLIRARLEHWFANGWEITEETLIGAATFGRSRWARARDQERTKHAQ